MELYDVRFANYTTADGSLVSAAAVPILCHGSGRTTTVLAIGTISDIGKSAAAACSRTASALLA
jgi:hypothetical protein